MMLPGLLTIGFPLVIAFVPMLFGMNKLAIAEMLGGYMAGVTVSGVFGQSSRTMLVVLGITLRNLLKLVLKLMVK